MEGFVFNTDTAKILLNGSAFTLPLSDETLTNMTARAEELYAFALECEHDERLIKTKLAEAIDGILGEGAFELITGGAYRVGMLDALEIFHYICGEFTDAWRKRLILMKCRGM